MFLEKTNRKIIPRWRDFQTTCAIGELDSAEKPKRLPSIVQAKTMEAAIAWGKYRSLWYALDLVGGAFVAHATDDPLVREAAEFIVREEEKSPKAAFDLARRIINGNRGPALPPTLESSTEQTRDEIRRAKLRLQDEPRNAIAWIDLARLLTILGNVKKAEEAVRIATRIDGDNRFVARSAARFFLHIGNGKTALQIIRNADATAADPWLVAGQIGVSSFSELPPRGVRAARKMVDDERFSPFARTELASAIATLELLDGNVRQSRKLFQQSLIAPTENSLAQAEWASKQISNLDADVPGTPLPRSFEAKSLYSFRFGDWNAALENAIGWRNDQSFSSRPAAVASFILITVFERFEDSEGLLRQSLISNPGDRTLSNNLAFALASRGRIDDAERALAGAAPETESDSAGISLSATRGLLKFRRHLYAEGRDLYFLAMSQARKMRNPAYEALAALYLTREELLANLPTRNETFLRAKVMASRLDEPEVQVVLRRISAMAEGIAENGAQNVGTKEYAGSD